MESEIVFKEPPMTVLITLVYNSKDLDTLHQDKFNSNMNYIYIYEFKGWEPWCVELCYYSSYYLGCHLINSHILFWKITLNVYKKFKSKVQILGFGITYPFLLCYYTHHTSFALLLVFSLNCWLSAVCWKSILTRQNSRNTKNVSNNLKASKGTATYVPFPFLGSHSNSWLYEERDQDLKCGWFFLWIMPLDIKYL